jgi:hypothetical protein
MKKCGKEEGAAGYIGDTPFPRGGSHALEGVFARLNVTTHKRRRRGIT